MKKSRWILITAQILTLSRVGASLGFTMVALNASYRTVAILLYAYAYVFDAFDGRFARRYKVSSSFGTSLDGFGDKFQTIVSALYLAALGFNVTACALILIRDVLIAALRAIWIQGSPLVPVRRWLGGLSGTPIKLLTLAILLHPGAAERHRTEIGACIWVIAAISLGVLMWSLWKERYRIWKAMNE
jgi:phosphatidylglycerophosphate synthase